MLKTDKQKLKIFKQPDSCIQQAFHLEENEKQNIRSPMDLQDMFSDNTFLVRAKSIRRPAPAFLYYPTDPLSGLFYVLCHDGIRHRQHCCLWYMHPTSA